MTKKQLAEAFAAELDEKGILAVPGDIDAGMRTQVAKALGHGTYHSFYVPHAGMIFVTHDWIRQNVVSSSHAEEGLSWSTSS